MTGQKDRYSTTEKLWDLDDKQLTTPKHDELVLQLMDKNYLKEKIISPFLDGSIIKIRAEHPLTGNNNFIIGYLDVFLEVETPISIKTHPDDTILIKCPHCGIHISSTLASVEELIKTKKEVGHNTCYGDRKFVVTEDIIDRSLPPQKHEYYIECKPTINSFGETLRQLRTYQNHIQRYSARYNPRENHQLFPSKWEYILFTPDLRFKDAFESQGIKVISP